MLLEHIVNGESRVVGLGEVDRIAPGFNVRPIRQAAARIARIAEHDGAKR